MLHGLINWMKKTDATNRQNGWAQGENTMRFRKETIEWKDDSTLNQPKQRGAIKDQPKLNWRTLAKRSMNFSV
jgi:hypothetical protein